MGMGMGMGTRTVGTGWGWGQSLRDWVGMGAKSMGMGWGRGQEPQRRLGMGTSSCPRAALYYAFADQKVTGSKTVKISSSGRQGHAYQVNALLVHHSHGVA